MNIGAIFDWDGVIIDSRQQHEESWDLLAAEEKRVLPEGHFLQGFGMKNTQIIPEILGWTKDPAEIERLSARKEALYRDVVLARGIAPLAGVRELLERLAEAGIPCALGSSTARRNIEAILGALGCGGFFREMVTAEDVSRGKPDPEVFLTAAKRIGVRPERCVVFEDAHVGIEAGLAGGMKVVAVTTTNPREELLGATRVVDRLDELRVEDLRDLVGATG